MENMDSCFTPQKYPNEAGGTPRKRNGRRSMGRFAYTFIYSGAAVDARALRLSIAGDSLTGLAESKVLLKMSHDGAAGTQAPQNVA